MDFTVVVVAALGQLVGVEAPLPRIEKVEAVGEVRAEPGMAALSLDELIERLPPVTAEGHYSEQLGKWVYQPAVEEMKRRVEAGTALAAAQWQRALTKAGVLVFRARWVEGCRVQ